MTRKRNSKDSVISVVDKNTDMIGEDNYFDNTGLETDNISNIISNHGVTTMDSSSMGFYDNKEEEPQESDVTPPR